MQCFYPLPNCTLLGKGPTSQWDGGKGTQDSPLENLLSWRVRDGQHMHVSWRLKEFKRRLSQQNEDGRIHVIKLMSSVTETKVGQRVGALKLRGTSCSTATLFLFIKKGGRCGKTQVLTDKHVLPASVPTGCGVLTVDRGHSEGTMGIQRALVPTSNYQSWTIRPARLS